MVGSVVAGLMARVEAPRFEMDPDTAGLWDQVKGDLHRQFGGRLGNGRALRVVARLYLEMSRQDRAGLARMVDRLKLEDAGYAPR